MTELGGYHAVRQPPAADELPRADPLGVLVGERRRQGGITKAGNSHARRALVEGAWAYRYPAKVSRHLQLRLGKLPAKIQAISGKAQVRLCKRYRQLTTRGKHVNQVVVGHCLRDGRLRLGHRPARAPGLLTGGHDEAAGAQQP